MLKTVDVIEGLKQQKRRNIGILSMLILLSLLCLITSLFIGSSDMDVPRLCSGVLELIHGTKSLEATLFQLRLERGLSAFFTGASLALAGVMMQALLRNPLADPYVLGISGGASVGAVVMLFFGAAMWAVYGAALAGAIAIAMFLYWFVKKDWGNESGGAASSQLLLTGVILAFGCTAIVTLFLSMASDGSLRGMVFWLIGDLEGSGINLLSVMVPVFVGIWVFKMARSVNLLSLYFQEAAALGVNVAKTRKSLFIGGSLLTACAVSNAGCIGFVGLIVPHVCRMFWGSDHRLIFPASALTGGVFLVFSDMLSRTLASPYQIPVGVVTALIGVPVFIFQLYRFRGS